MLWKLHIICELTIFTMCSVRACLIYKIVMNMMLMMMMLKMMMMLCKIAANEIQKRFSIK